MKRLKLALAAIAAVTGVGGAYVSHAQASSKAGTIFRWYTKPSGGAFTFSGTVGAASLACPGTGKFCLHGTATGKLPVTVLKAN
jgi:hypothetical protein